MLLVLLRPTKGLGEGDEHKIIGGQSSIGELRRRFK
jgi:hypothetical protein